MEDEFDIREPRVGEYEREYENALRPLTFDSFSGQDKVVDNLKVFVMAARMRKAALDHVLLHVIIELQVQKIRMDDAAKYLAFASQKTHFRIS